MLSVSNVNVSYEFELDDSEFEPHSGKPKDVAVIKIVDNTQSQNVKFMDHANFYEVDPSGDMDDTFKLLDSDELPLNEFFKRPLRISGFLWGPGTPVANVFNPWSAYFNNPRVVNRISNYKLMRAKLHVKFLLNGNPFYYGRILASYHPAKSVDAYGNSPLVSEDAVIESQRPHVFLDPTNSQGGDMILPFYWHKNYLDIVGAEWDQLGSIDMRSLPVLRNANGNVDPIIVHVYAWCEEIEFAGITQYEPSTIVPQSGSEIDEANAKGFISKPATAVASLAGKLKNVPVIGKYATATQTIAGATADVARNFGYCRPPVTENAAPRRPTIVSNMALTNTPDNVEKLTTDDKQELSIDPSIMNLPSVDCFNIKEIAKKESFLTSFSWQEGQGGLLWNSRVSPMLWRAIVGPPAQAWFPACAFAAMPFEHWSGSMKFRFQVVCSAFHKGRLEIIFDPTAGSASSEFNTVYTRIVDIADTQDFTIEIPHMQTTTLLSRAEPPFTPVSTQYGTTLLAPSSIGNGVIQVNASTFLTTPSSTVDAPIDINVFISMGDDFEVYNPGNGFQYYGFVPQSGTELHPVSNTTDELNAPLKEESEMIGGKLLDSSKIPLVFMGESIKSFRTLLKRYNMHRRDMFSNSTGVKAYHGIRPQYPAIRGSYGGAEDLTAAADPYMYVNQLLLHWVRHAFQGHRGSIRYKMLVGQYDSSYNHMTGVVMRRRFDQDNSWSDTRLDVAANTTQSQMARTWIAEGPLDYPDGPNGAVYFNSRVNPTIEFEVPWENASRCYYARNITYNSTSGNTRSQPGYKFALQGNSSDYDHVETWIAAGEDFQCYFFIGLPRLYQYLSPPGAQA